VQAFRSCFATVWAKLALNQRGAMAAMHFSVLYHWCIHFVTSV
jgi:hypothetical protein